MHNSEILIIINKNTPSSSRHHLPTLLHATSQAMGSHASRLPHANNKTTDDTGENRVGLMVMERRTHYCGW
jgi:hypothetical protein